MHKDTPAPPDLAQTRAIGTAQEFVLGFRGDIEGLRAVAILLVIAAHAGLEPVAGGFVGVDVFFVLSGYLITGLLAAELRQTGRIRLADFYARRLRRLLPALLFMVLGTMAAAVVLLAPSEQVGQAPDAAAAVLWLGNLHFAFRDLDYFGQDATASLFLHTWSLGVEEQFYLAWPVLLLLFLGQIRIRRGAYPLASPSVLRWWLLLVVVASLSSAIAFTYEEPSRAYFLPTSRAWQFAFGALAFTWPARAMRASGQPAIPTGRLWMAAGWIGLALVAFTALRIDGLTPYPGYWAVLPSIGTALILASGSRPHPAGVGTMLSLAPLQGLGRLSYGLYLWHWPVLLLGRTIVPADSAAATIALVVVAALLAALSYRIVERPIRLSRALKSRPAHTIAGATALLAVALALTVHWGSAASAWAQSREQLRHAATGLDLPEVYRKDCDDWYRSDRVIECAFGAEDAEHLAILIGDSIGTQWFPALARTYARENWRLVVFTKSSCPMVDAPYFHERIGRRYVECESWRAAVVERIRELRPDALFLGSSRHYPFTREEWIDGTSRILSRVAPAVGRAFIIRATPTLPFDGPACLARNAWRPRWLAALAADPCHAPIDSAQDDQVHHWLSLATDGHKNVDVLDFNSLVCPEGRCRAQHDGRATYRDHQHLAASFVETLAPAVASAAGVDTAGRAEPGSASP